VPWNVSASARVRLGGPSTQQRPIRTHAHATKRVASVEGAVYPDTEAKMAGGSVVLGSVVVVKAPGATRLLPSAQRAETAGTPG
jgi:hypothetical protein